MPTVAPGLPRSVNLIRVAKGRAWGPASLARRTDTTRSSPPASSSADAFAAPNSLRSKFDSARELMGAANSLRMVLCLPCSSSSSSDSLSPVVSTFNGTPCRGAAQTITPNQSGGSGTGCRPRAMSSDCAMVLVGGRPSGHRAAASGSCADTSASTR